MKDLLVAVTMMVFMLIAIPSFAFTFRSISLDEPIENQIKACEQEEKDVCYLKKENKQYEIFNLPRLSIITKTMISVYGNENRVGVIKETFNTKDADKMFSYLLDKYGSPRTIKGKIPKKIIVDRKTGIKTVIQCPVWSLDECYIMMNDIDENDRDNGKVIIVSKKIFKIEIRKKGFKEARR